MIPYLLWIIALGIVLVLNWEDIAWGNPPAFYIMTFVVSLGFSLYLFSNGWTEDERQMSRVADARQKAIDDEPQIKKQEMADGCSLYFYYGNGVKQAYTTKFVRCPNSTVDTEKKWSCGTSKSPKTCTENISTSESN